MFYYARSNLRMQSEFWWGSHKSEVHTYASYISCCNLLYVREGLGHGLSAALSEISLLLCDLVVDIGILDDKF